MKKLLGGLTIASLLAMGVGVGLATSQKDSLEAKAATSTSFAVGSVLYIDDSASNWDDANYEIGIWNHQGNVLNVASYDANSGYYKIVITDAACSSFNLVRNSSLEEGSHSFPDGSSQSDNVSVVAGKNLLIGGGYDWGKMTVSDWSVYDKGITPGEIKTETIYFRVPNDKCNYYVFTFETDEIVVDGFTVSVNYDLMGKWDSATQLSLLTKEVVFNPANLEGNSSYGILKASFNYYDINNVGVIIRAIQHTDGSSEFQTKDLVVGASGSGQMELIPGAYYYGTNDWNLWDDMASNLDMGAAAATAYDLGEDICSLSKPVADSLRSHMEANSTYLSNVPWDGYDYESVYSFLDQQCTAPKNNVNVINAMNKNDGSNYYIAVVTGVISALLLGSGCVLLARRRRSE